MCSRQRCAGLAVAEDGFAIGRLELTSKCYNSGNAIIFDFVVVSTLIAARVIGRRGCGNLATIQAGSVVVVFQKWDSGDAFSVAPGFMSVFSCVPLVRCYTCRLQCQARLRDESSRLVSHYYSFSAADLLLCGGGLVMLLGRDAR